MFPPAPESAALPSAAAASEMFPPVPESAALPSASAVVDNPPPPSPPPQESEERPDDASLARKMMAWKLPTDGASEGVVAMIGAADPWPALAVSAATGRSKQSSSKISSPSGSIPNPSSTPSSVPAQQKPNPTPSLVKANAAPAKPQPTALKKRNLVGLGVASESSPNDLPQRQGSSFVPRNRSIGGHHGRYDDNRRANNDGWGSNRGGPVKLQNHDGGPVKLQNHDGGPVKLQNHDQGDHGWSRPPHTNMPQPMQHGYFRPFIQVPRPVAPWPPFLSMEARSRPLVVPVGSNSSFVFPSSDPVCYVPPPFRENLRNAPYIARPVPGKILRLMDHTRVTLLKQIEYYFSNENLYKDVFLKKNMDDQGWVPISLIAGFNRVKQLTNDIPLILDALLDSRIVEIQGEKVRRRNDWMNWILPSLPKQYAIFPELQPTTTVHNRTSAN